jgi:hypothetical protein
MKQSPPDAQRTGLLAFAAILGVYSLWLLVPELVRPDLKSFPSTVAAADAAADHQTRARIAAHIGRIRGDLWTEAAIAQAARLGFGIGDQAPSEPGKEDATAAMRAVAWSPHDARAWLLLAAMNARLDWVNRRMIEWLKLSFYTGPNEADLMPLRLALITRSRAIDDAEVQELARQDLRTILTRLPSLRPAVADAYRSAFPEGKAFITTALTDIDPEFLKTLTGGAPRAN